MKLDKGESFPVGVELNLVPTFLKLVLKHTNSFKLYNGDTPVFEIPNFKHLIITV